jgi:ATP-dependent Lhr-like helicase
VDDSTVKLDRDVGIAFFEQFSQLRPVQLGAIREILLGRNVLISAGTGSGKTEAVVAPLSSRFRVESIRNSTTFLLYVCPTKALVNDLKRRLEGPLDRCGLRLAVRHGDRDELCEAKPPHVLLTTPESLGILLIKRHPILSGLKSVVLDEVHLLYNNQRGRMVGILMHRLQKMVPNPLQFAAISATVGNLDDLHAFLFGNFNEFTKLEFPAHRTIDGWIGSIESIQELSKKLSSLMSTPRKFLVFANSRREAEEITASLKRDDRLADRVVTHHSSLSPESREANERFFGTAQSAVCVSTSTLEMGIDIGDIDAVVLYGPPATIESMLQRIGRGNRRSNKTNAICFAHSNADSIRESAIFSTMLGLAVKGMMPNQKPFELYGAVGQQCLAVILEHEGAYTRVADIVEQVNCDREVTRELVEGILSELASNGIIRNHGFKNRYGADEGLWELRDKNLVWGNFPLASQQIEIFAEGRHIGTIPRANLMRLTTGKTFRFGGKRYKAGKVIDHKLQATQISGSGEDVSLIYSQTGLGGVETFLADSLWHWIFDVDQHSSYMEPTEWMRVSEVIQTIREKVKNFELPFFSDSTGTYYFTFAGVTLNQVILSWLGEDAKLCDDIYLKVKKPVNWKTIPKSCAELKNAAEKCFSKTDRQTIFQQMLPLELQREEWLESFLKDHDAVRVLKRLSESAPISIPNQLFNKLYKKN